MASTQHVVFLRRSSLHKRHTTESCHIGAHEGHAQRHAEYKHRYVVALVVCIDLRCVGVDVGIILWFSF